MICEESDDHSSEGNQMEGVVSDNQMEEVGNQMEEVSNQIEEIEGDHQVEAMKENRVERQPIPPSVNETRNSLLQMGFDSVLVDMVNP